MSKSTKVNKSLAIREYLNENPGAKPQKIVTDLNRKFARKGVTFTPAFVSTIKTQTKRKSSKTSSRGRKTSRVTPSVQMDALMAARKFAASCGGIEAARQALSSFAKVVS